jgi:anhydro-N-acetylmuramic acid kinase
MSDHGDETGFRSRYVSKSEHLLIGLMSGTSLDGVDAALVRIIEEGGRKPSIELLGHTYLPYSDELRSLVEALCSPALARIDDLTYVHYGLSEWYALAVERVISAAGIASSKVDAVSMHGQTVWHAPVPRDFPAPEGRAPEGRFKVKGTLQLGSAAVLRERCGIPVVSDHRARDMAAGGEGAPLAPYIDALLFGSASEGTIVQNIGGIGNATVIPAGAANEGVFAFDTGPGNMVMDALVIAHTGNAQRYDDRGAIAAKGKPCPEVISHFMTDSYFAQRPPKSTGREVYGRSFVEAFGVQAAGHGLSFEDSLATATAFTAESIAAAYRDFIFDSTPVSRVLVAGGGAMNPTLLSMLGERMPRGVRVSTTAECGVPDQAREAMAFALIAHESLMGRPGNLPSVTGASHPVILGSITL